LCVLSSSHGGHLAAFFSALKACLGALLAMRHVVLGALVTARLTDVGTQGADSPGMFAATGHCRRSQRADLRAIHVQRNAPRHRLDVLLLQTGSRAVIAGNNTSVAGFNTIIEGLMTHLVLQIISHKSLPSLPVQHWQTTQFAWSVQC